MAKIVFVAHPISGDVEGNIRKVIAICKSIHSKIVIPIFPGLLWMQYLGDSDVDKDLTDDTDRQYFRRPLFDELWLYGDHISEEMKKKIALAEKHGIPIVAKTPETHKALLAL
jgi:hypothetical protein